MIDKYKIDLIFVLIFNLIILKIFEYYIFMFILVYDGDFNLFYLC